MIRIAYLTKQDTSVQPFCVPMFSRCLLCRIYSLFDNNKSLIPTVHNVPPSNFNTSLVELVNRVAKWDDEKPTKNIKIYMSPSFIDKDNFSFFNSIETHLRAVIESMYLSSTWE